MTNVTHQSRYIQETINNKLEECTNCDGSGWVYEFYNDPISWKICPKCNKDDA